VAALQTNSKTELGRETWRCAGFVSYLPPPLVSYNTATHEGRPDEEDHGRDQGDGGPGQHRRRGTAGARQQAGHGELREILAHEILAISKSKNFCTEFKQSFKFSNNVSEFLEMAEKMFMCSKLGTY